ncbi:MAG: hypothetical protein FJZ59_02030 [Chlamydiae bacterium]|nr:hypothetical protein [Chlamydiota bacterium]
MSISSVTRGAFVTADEPLAREVSELRAYVIRRDRLTETEAERTRLRASFADYERAANNMGRPGLAKAFAVGGQMVAVSQAMSAAAAAGMTASTALPAVGSAILLISMFAAMDSDGSDALQALEVEMKNFFAGVNAKLAEMEGLILRNHAEDLHEFTKVRYEIGVAKSGLTALLNLSQEEVRDTRGDLHVQVERVAGKIESVARATRYSLDELRLDKLRDTVDAINHYESRGLSVEKLKRKVAYLERWLAQPPANKMLTGEYYTSTRDQGKYLETSSVAGRIGLLGKIAQDKKVVAFSKEEIDDLVDIEAFESILPTYVKAVKLLRAAGEDYDADGRMWAEKVVSPLAACKHVGYFLHANYKRYAETIYRDMQISYDRSVLAAKELLEARSRELADSLERELREEVGRIFLDVASIPHVETRDSPYDGGWFVAVPGGHAGMVHGRLSGQRGELLTFSALAVTPYDLFDVRATEVNLKGRFARLLPARDDVYLFPTYLPLEILPITTPIKSGLEAEKLGLGRVQVEALLVGRFQCDDGRWLYAPGHLKGNWEFPTDPYWISLEWSFVDVRGRVFPLQDDRFSLNFNGCEHCPGVWINNAPSANDRGDWVWNGDALAGSSLLSRWTSSRVDLKETDMKEEFDSCEGVHRSQVIRFPAKRATEWPAVNTMRYEKVTELRRELFDPAKGDPFKKEIFRSSLEEMREAYTLIHAYKEHIFGPQPSTTLTTMSSDLLTCFLIAQPLPALDLPPAPVSAYMEQRKLLSRKVKLLRAEILATPVAPRAPLPVAGMAHDPRVDALAARVDELTAMLMARDAQNRALVEQLERLMSMMGGGK